MLSRQAGGLICRNRLVIDVRTCRIIYNHSSTSVKAHAEGNAATSTSSPFQYTLSKEPKTLYDHPELYEMAFSYRDIKKEVSFLRDVYSKHSEGSLLQNVLELGCGPALHSSGLARTPGISRVVALDINDEMLKYAQWRYEQAGGKISLPKPKKGFAPPALSSPLSLVQGDMSTFDLKGKGSFDMIMCWLGTFSHLLENDQASQCFQRVAEHLRPGGLLILELAHPGDLFDGTYIIGDGGKEVWEVPLGETRKLLVEWGAEFDNFDPVTQILHRTVSVNILNGDSVELGMEEVVMQRQYTVQEIKFLAQGNGLQLLELYGETDLGVDLSHEEAYRMIAVLKKPS
ncbi:hypothetical protein CEUSTIGMA_g9958.t1 [Chlamydomonas eustigma]|uniref:Methyltransferase type 11 domain-containing protein n=1 Tax=Chlamydomonas eustigma TaxID=1157962 RepID=A0A250XHI8_9CHLO|nr:hypothetical protein CEUSTIGMA_g9958.t1 [Chlamydomonas eustigma]|eukprot:GAX82531.1 hypothetical protein CEUSTIGMA_g9958.t1 [Chlamydomonas eustigma]